MKPKRKREKTRENDKYGIRIKKNRNKIRIYMVRNTENKTTRNRCEDHKLSSSSGGSSSNETMVDLPLLISDVVWTLTFRSSIISLISMPVKAVRKSHASCSKVLSRLAFSRALRSASRPWVTSIDIRRLSLTRFGIARRDICKDGGMGNGISKRYLGY